VGRTGVTRATVRANGLRFAFTARGPADGPLALCLHGFPDTTATWRHLLPQLAEAGFRAVAVALRGYAPTEVPADRVTVPETLAADVNALHRALDGRRDAVVIGHDWGAIAAARAAAAAPDRWRRVVTLAVPPERFLVGAWRDLGQVWRARYAVAAQLPWAEQRLLDPELTGVRRLWRRWSPGHEPSPQDLGPLRTSLAAPGVPEAVLGYYRGLRRAAIAGRALSPRVPLPPQPHLVLHGRDDGCLDVRWAERAIGGLPHPASRVEIVEDTGHFLHLEAPEVVADRVLAFLGEVAR
jgi:pimeloyl-ACP methyl ester carboxylesterase